MLILASPIHSRGAYIGEFMKLYLILGLVVTWSLVQGREVQVSEMQQTQHMDNHFSLETNINQKVILDCQSFIQGLTIGELPKQIFYILEPHDCEDLQSRMSHSLRLLKKHCLDLDEIIRSDYTCQ
jgi:hypothetical protein